MDLLSLGKEPINESQPTGSDVRYEPEFEELQREIDKLSNPSASGGTEWTKVNQLASEILATKAKDLLVASYLAVAQIHINHLDGFAQGLRVYKDLLENFWENCFPSKKRMRGRIAAVEWWLEKSEAVLEALKAEPQESDRIQGFREDVQRIDTILRENTEDAPLLRPLERFVDSIPVKAEKKEPEAPPPPEGKAEAAAAMKPDLPKPTPAPPMEPGQIDSQSDADKVLRSALQSVRRVAEYYSHEDLADPRGYRWRRIAGWSMIQALPPSVDGQTEIPPPLNCGTILDDLNGLKDNANWEALARTAEEKFLGALLWLDLNRLVAVALAGLGDSYQLAHDTVCQETAYLVHRIPGLASLRYSDGTPFGDGETQQWLKGIGLGGTTATEGPVVTASGDSGDRMADIIQKAQALAQKKKVGEAVALLQHELRRSFSKQEQLLWRLGLSQILVNAKKAHLALPHLELVLHDIDAFRLEEWDPNLALKGLKMAWQGFSSRNDEVGKAQAADVLNRIAKLDPAEALLFAKR